MSITIYAVRRTCASGCELTSKVLSIDGYWFCDYTKEVCDLVSEKCLLLSWDCIRARSWFVSRRGKLPRPLVIFLKKLLRITGKYEFSGNMTNLQESGGFLKGKCCFFKVNLQGIPVPMFAEKFVICWIKFGFKFGDLKWVVRVRLFSRSSELSVAASAIKFDWTIIPLGPVVVY